MLEHLITGTSIICKLEHWEIQKFKNMSIDVFETLMIWALEYLKIQELYF